MLFADLKSILPNCHAWRKLSWEVICVFRKSHFLSSNGVSSSPHLSPVRRSLRRQLQGQRVHLPRSIRGNHEKAAEDFRFAEELKARNSAGFFSNGGAAMPQVLPTEVDASIPAP